MITIKNIYYCNKSLQHFEKKCYKNWLTNYCFATNCFATNINKKFNKNHKVLQQKTMCLYKLKVGDQNICHRFVRNKKVCINKKSVVEQQKKFYRFIYNKNYHLF